MYGRRNNPHWKWTLVCVTLWSIHHVSFLSSTPRSSNFGVQAQEITTSTTTTSSSSSSSSSPTEPAYPAYRLDPLNYSISYRQDVCDRNAAFQNGTVQLQDALRGLTLRPYFLAGINGTSPVLPDGTVPPDSRMPAIRIFDLLADRAGFTWRTSYGASNINQSLLLVNDDGTPQPPTFDTILSWAVQSFDVTGVEVVRTLERAAGGSSFVEGHIDASLIMVGMVTTETPPLDMFGFLAPFDWQVWLLTLLTMVLAGGAYQWMEWINQESDRQDLGDKPTETIYFAALSFNGDIKFEPSTDYARMFVLTLAFWGMILSSAYTANLASFLVVHNTPTLQVETVGDAVAINLPMCVVSGTAAELEVQKIYPQANLIAIDTTNPNDIFTALLGGRCTLAVTTLWHWDNARLDRTANVDCQLQWVGRVFKFAKSGFVTYSDSGTLCSNLIRDVLSLHISSMLDDGTINEILDEYLASIRTIDCAAVGGESTDSGDSGGSGDSGDGSSGSSSSSSGDNIPSLSLRDLGGLFIVIYLSGALSCIAAMISWCHKKRKVQRKRDRGDHRANGSLRTDDIVVKSSLRLKQEGARGDDRRIDPFTTTGSQSVGVPDSPSGSDDEYEGGGSSKERHQIVSKLDAMRQELEEMRSLILLQQHNP